MHDCFVLAHVNIRVAELFGTKLNSKYRDKNQAELSIYAMVREKVEAVNVIEDTADLREIS